MQPGRSIDHALVLVVFDCSCTMFGRTGLDGGGGALPARKSIAVTVVASNPFGVHDTDINPEL